MGRTLYQRLEARRRELEDQVVVYALTSRRPPERLVRDFVKARAEAEAARREEVERVRRHGMFDRLFGHHAAG